MSVRKLIGMEAVSAAASLFLEPHIFSKLDKRLQSLTGLYGILRCMEIGTIPALAAYDDTGKLIGMSWGTFEAPGEYVAHTMFLRHIKTVRYTLELEKLLIESYPEVKRIVGQIPKDNRAVLLYSRRCGYVECGYELHVYYINEDAISVPCVRMVKNIEV